MWATEVLEAELELERMVEMSLTKSKARCSADVHDSFGVSFHQCIRNVWKDGFCRQHHPDTVAARFAATEARWDAENKKQQAAYRVVEAEWAVLKAAEKMFGGNQAPGSELGLAVKKLRDLRKELAKL